MKGFITEVVEGVVWGRLFDHGTEFEFWTPILSILEDQRVDLEPGRYCSVLNGHLLIDKAIWTTHDIELAKERGRALASAFPSEQCGGK
jgi:hypothetical protein